MADTGTLFLDEIGDIPLALQPKLLRVLQEQEFERLGSGKTHRINVRLIAATHRDLTEMVRRKEFRSDFYYRINVYPVVLPPLRERRQDIPQLVLHFVEIFARRMGKRIDHVPKETLEAFTLAYATLGYSLCEDSKPEPGYRKIALYITEDGKPSHAAIEDIILGGWSSKLGDWEDIQHNTLAALEAGPGSSAYGTATRYLKKRATSAPARAGPMSN